MMYLPAEGMYTPMQAYPVFQKGMSYVTWSKEGFAGKRSDESLQSMADAGINYVAIVVTWYQEEFDSVEIRPNDERSPSDESVRHVIRKAHELGMAVLLKPHIDLIRGDGYSRGDIGFQKEEKWQEWLVYYTKFVGHYAKIAQEEKCEMFCVGTELAFAASRTDMWKNVIIPGVRKVYSGKITYAANWDEYKNVEFWNELDYAGIDAYFPLSSKTNPSYEDIKAGWGNWLGEIERWQSIIKKPVIFSECGYCSADSAARKPWEEAFTGTPNVQLQADCYKAVFETFWGKPWFSGMYWWNWNTYPGSGGEKNKSFTPQNKLALNYIKEWYAKQPHIGAPNASTIALAKAELDDKLGSQESITRANSSGITTTGAMAGRKIYAEEMR